MEEIASVLVAIAIQMKVVKAKRINRDSPLFCVLLKAGFDLLTDVTHFVKLPSYASID